MTEINGTLNWMNEKKNNDEEKAKKNTETEGEEKNQMIRVVRNEEEKWTSKLLI